MWISDATGLPLREKMQDTTPQPSQPLKISAVYAYGADVHVPKPAELAERARLSRTYDMVEQMEWEQMNGGSPPNR